jgi:hypothetical protein
LGASTDWRILSPIILSISAVSQLSTASCLRFVDARNGFSFAGSPTGEDGGSKKPWKQRLRVKSARDEEALNLHCAKKCRGRDVRVRVEVRRAPWRRRMRAGGGPRTRWGERVGTELRRRKCAVRALGVEEKVIARESA